MDYEKNVCPYDVAQLLTAKNVLDWAIEQEERVHKHNQTLLGLIDDVIMNEVVRQVRIKKLEDYTTLELEQELELRRKTIITSSEVLLKN